MIQYIDDLRIIFLGYTLMHQFHPMTISYFDYKSIKKKIRKILNKYIHELSNPPRDMIHHVYFGYEGRLSPMPWVEYRLNTKNLESLGKILNKLEELKRNPLIANEVMAIIDNSI